MCNVNKTEKKAIRFLALYDNKSLEKSCENGMIKIS